MTEVRLRVYVANVSIPLKCTGLIFCFCLFPASRFYEFNNCVDIMEVMKTSSF